MLFLMIINLNYFFIFIYFWLRWVFVTAHGFSLVMVRGRSSLLQWERFLIAMASLTVEHRP